MISLKHLVASVALAAAFLVTPLVPVASAATVGSKTTPHHATTLVKTKVTHKVTKHKKKAPVKKSAVKSAKKSVKPLAKKGVKPLVKKKTTTKVAKSKLHHPQLHHA